jgi:hypothetical protein
MEKILQVLVQASKSYVYILLGVLVLAVIVSAIVYFIEPVYNVVVKEVEKEQKKRIPFCRQASVTAVDPPKKELMGKHSQKQTMTIKFDDPLITKPTTFEDTTRSGHDVNDIIMFNLEYENKSGCTYGLPTDKITYDDKGKDFEIVAMTAKDKGKFTVYYDKHDKESTGHRYHRTGRRLSREVPAGQGLRSHRHAQGQGRRRRNA